MRGIRGSADYCNGTSRNPSLYHHRGQHKTTYVFAMYFSSIRDARQEPSIVDRRQKGGVHRMCGQEVVGKVYEKEVENHSHKITLAHWFLSTTVVRMQCNRN